MLTGFEVSYQLCLFWCYILLPYSVGLAGGGIMDGSPVLVKGIGVSFVSTLSLVTLLGDFVL